MADQGIAVADLIVAVADGIREARDRSKGKEAVLALSGCEIELAAKVTYDGKAGLKFWIVEVGGGGGTENTSKVKLTFGAAGAPVVFAVQNDAPETIPDKQPRSSS